MFGLPTCTRTTDRDTLARYASHYSEISGHATTVEDLDQPGQAVRVLELDGRIVGGFVVRWQAPFRYLAMKPAEEELLAEIDLEDTIETTRNWMSRGLPKSARALFYATMVLEGLMSGKRYGLGGTASPRIRDMHMRYLPEMLYVGPLLNPDGHVNPHGWLYGGRISQMLVNLPELLLRRSTRTKGGAGARQLSSVSARP